MGSFVGSTEKENTEFFCYGIPAQHHILPPPPVFFYFIQYL